LSCHAPAVLLVSIAHWSELLNWLVVVMFTGQ